MKTWRTWPARRQGAGMGGQPVSTGKFRHAAEQTFGRPSAQQDPVLRIGQPEQRAVARRPGGLGGTGGEILRVAGAPGGADGSERADTASGGAGAYSSAEIKQGLREIRGPGAGSGMRAKPVGGSGERGLGRGQGRGDGEEAGGDALHIAVHGHDRNAEGNGGDSAGRVGPDPGQRQESLDSIGKLAAKCCHGFRTGMQVAGTGVITQACPGGHDGFGRCGGQGMYIREPGEETLVVGDHGGHRRLLQHDLAEPHLVGIGRLARQGAPGHGTAMAIIPG